MAAKNVNAIIGENLTLMPTNLADVKAPQAPPADFDPLRAEDRVLMRYGFPPRPDAQRYPEAARAWKEILSRKLAHIQPQLRIRPEKKEPGQIKGAATALTSPVWSGGVMLNGGPFTCVSGAWIVPAVVPPAGSGDGDWWSVAWVGIDGYNSPDVLQAGTGQHVKRSGGVVTTEYFAWYEWYPNNWTEISNLAVHPGDAISTLVRYTGMQNGVGQGTATVSNLTTGQSATVALTAPAGTTLSGNCAEWIMERPGINGVTASLPEYEHITFYSTFASSATQTYNGSQAQALNMTNASGAVLSTGALGSSDWDCTFEASA